jgi:hypothetical protein
LARHFPLPSFLSTKRSRMFAIATAGALTVATAASLAATAPAGSSPASASADAAYTSTIGQQAAARSASDGVGQAVMFARMRSLAGDREQQLAAQKAAAKAAASKAAAARAAAAKATALKSAEQAAARKAAAQRTQQAQPARQAAVTTPSGSPEQIAQQMLSQFGWSSSQFSCLQPLWALESGWNIYASNPSSGAYGIPQALPGSKMASAGPDWQSDAATQIRWGLSYIQGTYGSPCAAWSHEEADGWY